MTIIVNWFGPYEENEINRRTPDNPRLHLIFGRRYDDEFDKLYYAGICDDQTLRKRASTVFSRKYYRAEIPYASPELGDVSELVETTLAKVWRVHFTEKKAGFHIGEKLLSIVMHWYKPDRYSLKKRPQMLGELPNFLLWNGSHWQTGTI